MNKSQLEVYLAAPLFSAAERSFNSFLKESLDGICTVYLPQEDGALMPSLLEAGHSPEQSSKIVFRNDLNAILRCDVFLMVLDGRSVDEGACFELGVAFSHKKHCIGLQTDFRRLAPFGNNPMISGALAQVHSDVESLRHALRALAASKVG